MSHILIEVDATGQTKFGGKVESKSQAIGMIVGALNSVLAQPLQPTETPPDPVQAMQLHSLKVLAAAAHAVLNPPVEEPPKPGILLATAVPRINGFGKHGGGG